MKICPLCKRDYADDLGFCLEDGSPLNAASNTVELTRRDTEQFERETFVRPSPQTSTTKRSSNSFAVVAMVAILLLGVGVLLAAGIGGYMYYSAAGRRTELADDPPSTPKPIRESTINNSKPDLPTVNHNMNTSNRPANLRVVDPNTEPGERPSNGREIPRTISGGVLNGKAVTLPKPAYPPAARAVRAEGAVSVQVLVDEAGNVVSASAVSGHPLLRAAAVAAARGAKFAPTMLSGTPVKVSGVITYQMRLDEPAKSKY